MDLILNEQKLKIRQLDKWTLSSQGLYTQNKRGIDIRHRREMTGDTSKGHPTLEIPRSRPVKFQKFKKDLGLSVI